MRQQYHSRKIKQDTYIWDVNKLLKKCSELKIVEIPLLHIQELNEPYWQTSENLPLTCKEISEHAQLIYQSDLSYPILLCPEKKIIDGMHRVCKAYLENKTSILAQILEALPKPDFINVDLKTLPY